MNTTLTSTLRVYDETDGTKALVDTTDRAEITRLLGAAGIVFEQWEANAPLTAASDQDEILQLATTAVGMSSDIDEALTPLVYVVAGQLLAYHIARVKGRDPDQPRGLSKVTVTR